MTATFSAPVDPGRIVYRQYTRDRLSIAAGTDPGNRQFTTTRFELDRYTVGDEDGDVSQDGILTFQDNPGYTLNFLLDGTTDLHYTFGAYWLVSLDGVQVLDTSAHELYATASGTHGLLPRTFVPPAAHTANYDLAINNWANPGALMQQWAALPLHYPVPLVVDP